MTSRKGGSAFRGRVESTLTLKESCGELGLGG